MSIRPDAPLTARIVEWNDEKGYGYLQVGNGRLFLHRRDFAERHKRPAVGDVIRFVGGVDAKGRTCAREAVHANDGGRLTVLTLGVLGTLLVLPALALYRSGVDWRWAGGYAVLVSAASYTSYAVDKRRARQQEWRISEAVLHVTELLGGWPGAFLAQRRLRHKVSKRGYQLAFWLIVLAYQFAAFDSLQNWQFSRSAWDYLDRTVRSGAVVPPQPGSALSPNSEVGWRRA